MDGNRCRELPQFATLLFASAESWPESSGKSTPFVFASNQSALRYDPNEDMPPLVGMTLGDLVQPNIISLPPAFRTGGLSRALDRVLPVQTDHVAHTSFCWNGRLIPGDDVRCTISLAVGPAIAGVVRT